MGIFYATYTVQRPTGNTTQYTANDAWADTTPTVGGFLLAELAGISGSIVDAVIQSTIDPATLLQGEVWLFDASVTAITDNAVFALSDANALTLVGVIPFTLASSVAGSGTNSMAHVIGIDTGFDCRVKAGLYFLIKVKNAYTPASAESLQFRFKIRKEP